jgi:hypothetical protein
LDKQKELRIEAPPKDAVGMKAIKSTFKQMSGRISKRKALSLLNKVYQKD